GYGVGARCQLIFTDEISIIILANRREILLETPPQNCAAFFTNQSVDGGRNMEYYLTGES
ncbi:hypothetical protein CEN47_17945, partial [Fischerella thermalis CCMEE 5319]